MPGARHRASEQTAGAIGLRHQQSSDAVVHSIHSCHTAALRSPCFTFRHVCQSGQALYRHTAVQLYCHTKTILPPLPACLTDLVRVHRVVHERPACARGVQRQYNRQIQITLYCRPPQECPPVECEAQEGLGLRLVEVVEVVSRLVCWSGWRGGGRWLRGGFNCCPLPASILVASAGPGNNKQASPEAPVPKTPAKPYSTTT